MPTWITRRLCIRLLIACVLGALLALVFKPMFTPSPASSNTTEHTGDASFSESRASQDQGKNPRTVLLVHGIFDSPKKFRALRARLEARGFQIDALDLTPSGARHGLDPLARQVQAHVNERFSQEPFALVGFSMGGLVSRAYIQKMMEPDKRLVAFATISTPHRGSLWGWLHPSKGARQMRPGSPWMRDINANLGALADQPFLNLWSPLDLMIVPSWSSRVNVGKESIHWVPAHPLMLFDKEVARQLGTFLEAAFNSFPSV